MSRKSPPTDEELEREDNEWALRQAEQRRLSAINQKLEAAGLNLDDLIELVEARQMGRY